MRSFVVVGLLVLVASACTKHNPDSCCSTAEQCSSFGLDGITGCESGKTCDQLGTCQPIQCVSSIDCTQPGSPICSGNLCVASCADDDQCVGLSGSHCASDGTCVACLADSDCGGEAPVCDTTSHACRGCAEDDECAGGVCLEADGTCVADGSVWFLAATGTDTGDCTRSAPCKTLDYVLPKTVSSKNTIHILTGSLGLTPIGNPTNLNIDFPVYIDGTNTVISGPATGPAITVRATLVTLSHVTVSTQMGDTLSVTSGAGLRLFDTKVNRIVDVTGGSLQASHATFNGGVGIGYGINCTDGATSVTNSQFTGARITGMNCQVVLKQSRFDETGDGGFDLDGGSALVENNLIVEANGISDSSYVFSALPGSIVRFNTFVCTDQVPSDGNAFGCDSSVEVTSNIFAWGSMHPHGSGCTTRYSLHDAVAVPEQTQGVGNVVADGASIFLAKGAGDFHLSTTSTAVGAGEPGLNVTVDHDGNPRPSPAGSNPDIGAFEAP